MSATATVAPKSPKSPKVSDADKALVNDPAVILGYDSNKSIRTLGERYAALVTGVDDVRLEQIRQNFMLGAVADCLFPNISRLTGAHIAAASLARTAKDKTAEQIRANGAARKRWYTVLKANDVATPRTDGGANNTKKKADAPAADAQSVTTKETPAQTVVPAKKGYATVAEGHAKLVADLAAIRADMDKYPTAYTSNHIKIIDNANRALASLKIEE